MNKIVKLYIFLIFLTALFIGITNFREYPAFITQIKNPVLLHEILESTTTILFFLIFLKANKLYTQLQDKRMAIIAGGFLVGTALNTYHVAVLESLYYLMLTPAGFKLNPSFVYLLAEKIIMPTAIFISVFYSEKSSFIEKEKMNKFRNKTYLLFFSVFFLVTFLDQFVFPYMTEQALYKFSLLEVNLEIYDEVVYYLSAFILMDRRLLNNKNIFSKFTVGCTLYGAMQLFYLAYYTNPEYIPLFRHFLHILRVLVFILLFFGLEDIRIKPDIRTLRQKLLAYLSLFLTISYLIFISLLSVVYEVSLPHNAPFVFLEFFLFLSTFIYIYATKLTNSISDISSVINKYKPGEKSEKIPITSEDEIGVLAGRLNEIIDREWNYSQELLGKQARIQGLLNKEQLLFKITESIRRSLNIEEILKTICYEIAKTFDIERVGIAKILDKENYQDFIIKAQYTSSETIKTPEILEKNYKLLGGFMANQVFPSKKPLILENVYKSDIPEFIKNLYEILEIKSIICFPLISKNELWGFMTLSKIDDYKYWSDEEISLLSSITDQIQIAIIQAELYEKEKQIAQKEALLREVISAISSTLDINQIKQTIVTSIGSAFNADRCFIIEFTDKFERLDEYSEYLSFPDIKSLVGVDLEEEKYYEWISKADKTDLIIPDMEKYIEENNLQHTPAQKHVEEYNVKSAITFKIVHLGKFLGIFAMHFTKNKHIFSPKEIEFLNAVTNQAGIVLYQSELYETVKKTVEREILLRKITAELRNILDTKEIKKYFVETVCKYFDADRCLFNEYDKDLKKLVPFELELIESTDIKQSLINVDIQEKFPELIKKSMSGKNIIIKDIEKTYLTNKLPGYKSLANLYKEGVKSDYGLSIKYKDNYYGTLILHYMIKKRELSHEELNFLKTVGKQTGVALYQAELYEKEKQTAEREVTLRETIKFIRSTLDIEEIKKYFVVLTGRYFNADRCYFQEFSKEKGLTFSIKTENLQSYETKSFKNIDTGKEFPEIVAKAMKGKNIIIKDVEKLYSRYSKTKIGTNKSLQYLYDIGVKSDYGLAVKYKGFHYGTLVMHFTAEKRILNTDEINFLKVIRDQVGIALYQAELYEKIQQQANKERILREIISSIKITTNLSEAYNILLEKIGQIYDIERVVFLESSPLQKDELFVKYEYIAANKDLDINNIVFPKGCVDAFLSLIPNRETLIVNDSQEFCNSQICSDKQSCDFLQKHKINSFITTPLVKYNRSTRVLGFIVLCYSGKRIWTDEEVELIKAISESIVAVIWEITKLIEFEELRNSFILTLAHDFQVPLVGERKALEYILSRAPEDTLSKYRVILQETINSNLSITALLTKLLDIYNYEAGTKKITIEANNLPDLIFEIIEGLQEQANSKQISLLAEIMENMPLIYFDRAEIKKVIYTLIENAIVYIQKGGTVDIKSYIKDQKVFFEVKDNGPGISEEIQEILFKRYEMALTVERKIGGGIGLYLAKQIIQAHNGYIGFESKVGEGSTFYFSIPLNISG